MTRATGDGTGNALLGPSRRAEIYTIHATRDDRSLITHRIIADTAVAQAEQLKDAGWRVHICGSGGREFKASEFYQLLNYSRIG
ncbi:MAG: hypothetical protein NT113_25130 [Hyphomicrobiales bacterium]|jgi:hypothetical protein|nr:hypothetical protein [Hyphomicrobiales bacterium]